MLWSLALSIIIAIVMGFVLYSAIYEIASQLEQKKNLSIWDYIRILRFSAVFFIILGIIVPSIMMAKRFRDMNFPPLISVGVVLFVNSIDVLLLSQILGNKVYEHTIIGNCFNLALMLVLLLMPPSEGDHNVRPNLYSEIDLNQQNRRENAQRFLRENGHYEAYAAKGMDSTGPAPSHNSFGKQATSFGKKNYRPL